ncbi:MAG: ABC transporter ATP-binding protein, partial [Chloroflexi bacterium]|nr:ABC transporter ATP-binding protein [Chloroflexota bacterium]
MDVSFELETGCVLGLAGPNGAGKSTLLRMLATIQRPTKGQVLVDGLDALRKARQARRLIGYVPDLYGFYDDTKVGEYLAFFARCYGISGRLRTAAITELLKLVDLYDYRFANCKSLSRGLQQKLLIARALLHEPKLLLLDEPLTGLDAESRLEMLEVFRELASMGKAVIISSHHMADLVDVCDRIGLMSTGQLTTQGTVPELIRELEVTAHVRLVVLDEPERAQRILMEIPAVTNLEMAHLSFSFDCQGGRAAQASTLAALV